MTNAELLALEPGDIIRRKSGKRTLRIVVSGPGKTKTGRFGPVGLVKIGTSWTDPNPTAWFDAWVIREEYMATGSRGMSREYAWALRCYRPVGGVHRRFRNKRSDHEGHDIQRCGA